MTKVKKNVSFLPKISLAFDIHLNVLNLETILAKETFYEASEHVYRKHNNHNAEIQHNEENASNPNEKEHFILL